MKNNLFLRILFIMLLAFTVNSFIYLSFANIYSSSILNHESFSKQFNNGIYQYRFLSAYFLNEIYTALGNVDISYESFKLKFLNPDSEPRMYLSFYILNTFFLVLSSAMMVLITNTKNFFATESEKLLIVILGVFSIVLSQFVILPYDCSSYFLLLLFFYILIKYLNLEKNTTLIALAICIIVSTFNRESSALSLALAATVLISKNGLNKKTIIPISFLAFCFVATYLGMRVFNHSFATNDGNLLLENFSQPKNYLGMLFWVVFFGVTYSIANNKRTKQNILIFHLFSIPYIVMCLYTGILYEIRLYVPLFITSIFLAKLGFERELI